MMKRLVIALFFCASTALADGPLFKSSDTFTQQEFSNIYWDIKNPFIDAGNAKILNITTGTITALTVSTMTRVSSATIAAATITTASITALTVSTITAASSATITNLSVTNINGAAYSAVTAGQLPATATNDNAAAGKLGEYVEAIVSAVNSGASGVWGNAASISLTAGDWDVAENNYSQANGATLTGPWQDAISINSGATTTDHVLGSNWVLNDFSAGLATTAQQAIPIVAYRISLSATTTVYWKFVATYSAGQPKAYGRLSARRAR